MLGTGAGPGTGAIRDGVRMLPTVMATSPEPVACCSFLVVAAAGAGTGAGVGADPRVLAIPPRVPAGRELAAEPSPAPCCSFRPVTAKKGQNQDA